MNKKEHLIKVRPTIEFDVYSNILNDVLQAMENYADEQLLIQLVSVSLPTDDEIDKKAIEYGTNLIKGRIVWEQENQEKRRAFKDGCKYVKGYER